MTKISVIIPVYNAEAVLERCLNSLASQSFRDWEAICIDDGSTDGSAAILDSFASKDKRFVVVHKENAGVGAARNAATSLARGEYFLYVDSDDFLHPQTMEICLGLSEKSSSDIVCFTYDRKYRTGVTIRHFLHLPEKKKPVFKHYDMDSVEFIVTNNIWDYATEYSVKDKWAVKHCQPWRCFYKAELVKKIPFLDGVIYEDFPWWSEVLLGVRKAVILNLPLYFYYPSFGGFIFSYAQKKRIESLKKCLAYADKVMEAKAEPAVLEVWKKNFRTPFADKLEKKIKKYA